MDDSSQPGRGEPRWRRWLPHGGLVGLAILAFGVIVPGIVYVGRAGEPYSPLNHFISELGEVGVSPLAWVFNASMVVSGSVLGLLLAALGWLIPSRAGRAAGTFGGVAGAAVVGIGLVPMNDLMPHLRWAFLFFWSGLACVALFAVALWRDRSRHLPRWLTGFALASLAVFLLFLAWPIVFGLPDRRMLDPGSGVARPSLWPDAALEWAVQLTVVLFAVVGSLAAGWARRGRKG